MSLSLEYLKSEYLEKLNLYLETLSRVDGHSTKVSIPEIIKEFSDLDNPAASIETYFEVFYEAELLLSSMKNLNKHFSEENDRKIRNNLSGTAVVRAGGAKETAMALVADFEKLLQEIKHKYWNSLYNELKKTKNPVNEVIKAYKKKPENYSKQLCAYLLCRAGADRKVVYDVINNAGLELETEIIPNFGKDIEFRIYLMIDHKASKFLNLDSINISNGLNRDTIRKFGTIIESEKSEFPQPSANSEDVRRKIAIGKIMNNLIIEKINEDVPINRVAIAAEYETEISKSRERKNQQLDVQARKLRSGATILDSLENVQDIFDLYRVNRLEGIRDSALKFRDSREAINGKIIKDKQFTRVTKLPHQILSHIINHF